jgi:hypothetical protein
MVQTRGMARGLAVIWLLVILALSAFGMLAATSGLPPPAGSTAAWVMGIAAVVAAASILLELRRDAFAASRPLGLFAGSMAATGVLALLSGAPANALTLGLSAGSALVTAVAWGLRARTQRAASPWPNQLVERFGAEPVREVRGVQFVVQPSQLTARSGEAFTVEVVAQNCWDTPRTLTIALATEASFAEGRSPVHLPPAAQLVLGPGEVGQLLLRGAAVEAAVGEHRLQVQPSVEGKGGTRVRKWRAPELKPTVDVAMDLLTIFGGFSLGEDGLTLSVKLVGAAPKADLSPPTATAQSVWRPPV